MTSSFDGILVTGATGYVGGHLLARLENSGHKVRCLTRRPQSLWCTDRPQRDVVAGDLLKRESLVDAMRGIEVAYYLVHSMGGTGDFGELDRRAARNFAAAARQAGVKRIVYLGGLGSGDDLSAHLASRHEVGAILRSSGVPTIELRASIVIGAGSASFETVRALVEHLPAIPAPSWLTTSAQPIAIGDVIDYLVAALDPRVPPSQIIEIGGRDRVTYGEVIREYARQRNLRRRMIPLPAVTARASSPVLGVVTPSHGRIAAAMMDSLRNETVVNSSVARELFPIRPMGLSDAIHHALSGEDHEFAETRWADMPAQKTRPRWGGTPVGRRMVSSFTVPVVGPPEHAFDPIQRIGGPTGWYAVDWFWQLRGLIDRLRGGQGLRRGRRHPQDLQVGDLVDFWRVERFEPRRKLLLAADMRMPGRLWLQFDVEEREEGTHIRQTTVFDPAGYIGVLYWYLLYPVHHTIFAAMLRGLAGARGGARVSGRVCPRRCL